MTGTPYSSVIHLQRSKLIIIGRFTPDRSAIVDISLQKLGGDSHHICMYIGDYCYTQYLHHTIIILHDELKHYVVNVTSAMITEDLIL